MPCRAYYYYCVAAGSLPSSPNPSPPTPYTRNSSTHTQEHGCGENDPNGPVFDPVHGVIHHFYQIHLAAPPGHGPDYGHFVSKDFVNWAAMPTAIWNGYDSSFTPPKVTKYDNEAIFTDSAVVVDGAGPGGKGPGIVNIYPGLCNKNDWPACGTGTLLAQAVPADYAGDELLTNWTKPSYNPIMENTQRDPSTPWKTPSGEWRLRTYNSIVYGSASDADMLAGKWYEIGANTQSFRTCECPSFYPLPAASPGSEDVYSAMREAGTLPTHVHKTSCGGDWWQLGTYDAGKPKMPDNFTATPGWEDLFAQRKIDQGNFYASKDNEYPTKAGGTRRINWGWATVPPASTQTLPREITFNAAARQMQQYPIAELAGLRQAAAVDKTGVAVAAGASVDLGLPTGVAKNSETVVVFELPSEAASFGVTVGAPSAPAPSPGTKVGTMMKGVDLPGNDYNITHYPPKTDPKACEAACAADSKCKAWTYVIRGSPAGSGDCCLKGKVACPHTGMNTCTSGAKVETSVDGCGSSGGGASLSCTVDYVPNATAAVNAVSVDCGGSKDTVNLVKGETTLELRIYADVTFAEAYFQGGRAAITKTVALTDTSAVSVTSTGGAVTAKSVTSYPLKSIWTTPDAVRKAPRVYN